MTRVYHLWLTTRIVGSNGNAGNPVIPVSPAIISSANVNNVSWQVNWDDLFKRENKNYKRCTVRFQLNSVGFTRTDTDWGTYNGVLTCNLQSSSVGTTTFGTPLGLIYPIDNPCAPAGNDTRAFFLNTLDKVQGVDVLVPSGNSYFTLSWYNSNNVSLMTPLYDYQILLQFELSEPIEPTIVSVPTIIKEQPIKKRKTK